jgi:hypothetical protein
MGQSPYQQPKNKICCAILNKSESLPLDCKANMVHKHQSMQHGEGRDVVAISPHTMSSIGKPVNGWNKFEPDALGFVPSVAQKLIEECSEELYKRSHDCRTSQVDSTIKLPNLLTSSKVDKSFEDSCNRVRDHHCRRKSRRINHCRIIVGKVHVHFPKNMDNTISDRRLRINKGGLRIQTTVTRKPSTVVAFIQFIWKKIS